MHMHIYRCKNLHYCYILPLHKKLITEDMLKFHTYIYKHTHTHADTPYTYTVVQFKYFFIFIEKYMFFQNKWYVLNVFFKLQCVCMLYVWEHEFYVCVRESTWMYVCVFAVCVFVCVREHQCVCGVYAACVCICVRIRERKHESMCVCVREHACVWV